MSLRKPLTFLAMLGFYALFAGEVSRNEAIAGVTLAVVMTAYASLLRRLRHRHLSLASAPWAHLVLGSAASLVSDTLRVGAVLLRSLNRRPRGAVGLVSRQPFRSGSDNPRDAGRRGLVTLGISLAPNGYVLELPAGGDAIILHRLVDVAPATDRKWPVS